MGDQGAKAVGSLSLSWADQINKGGREKVLEKWVRPKNEWKVAEREIVHCYSMVLYLPTGTWRALSGCWCTIWWSGSEKNLHVCWKGRNLYYRLRHWMICSVKHLDIFYFIVLWYIWNAKPGVKPNLSE